MKANEVKTMNDFSKLINESEEWNLDFDTIISSNGWTSDTDETYGICHSQNERLEFDENGIAVVNTITYVD